MSSLIRTIEKNMMKAAGLRKFTTKMQHPKTGNLITVSVVADKEANVYGKRWPRAVPAKFAFTNDKAMDFIARNARELMRHEL